MKRFSLRSTYFGGAALLAALTFGCKDNNKEQPTPAQQQANANQTAEDNHQMISATQEMMDATAGAFADQGITNGRKLSEGRESTWGCKPSVSGNFNLNTSFKDSLIYSGSITLDYGDGSTCPDSLHRRTGKITDTFVYSLSLKNNWSYTSSETISFEGFKKDSVVFDGAIAINSASKSPTTVEAQSAKITYPDGTTANWSGNLSFDYTHINQCRDWGGTELSVTGALNGTARGQNNFSASITTAILFKNSCSTSHQFIPVSGVLDITSDGSAATLDYGDGSCDKSYTVTSNGTTTVHSWEKNNL